MKNLKTAISLFLFVFVATLFTPVQAQPKGKKGEKRNEVREYISENIIPVLAEQRVKLDELMTQEDKNAIDALRKKLYEQKKGERELTRQGNKGHKGQRAHNPQAKKTENEAVKGILSEVAAIADKYSDQIKGLFEDIADQKQQWTTDIQAIITNKNAKKPSKKGEQLDKVMAATKFILMNPERMQQKATKEALKKEVRAYAKENIVPVVKQMTLAVGKMLTAEEVKQIEQVKQQQRADKNSSKEQKRETISKVLDAIVANHETEIANLQTGVADKKALWVTDLTAIVEKHGADTDKVAKRVERMLSAKSQIMKSVAVKHKKPSKEKSKEVAKYIRTNVVPVVAEQRTQFDANLSDEEKATIDRLRAQNKKLAIKYKALVKQKKANNEVTEEMKAEFVKLKQQKQRIIRKASAIAKAHKEELKAMYAEIAPERETWKKDLSAMKHNDAPKQNKAVENKQSPKKHKAKKNNPLKRILSPAGFILFDANKGAEKKQVEKTSVVVSLEAFPNPAKTTTTVKYELQEASRITILLVNISGDVIYQTTTVSKEAGSYSEEISLDGLKNGVYLLKARTPKSVVTKRLVIVE